jgi:DNA polymerase-3 subunit alpha
MKYVNLHNHTEASIADGLFGPKRWVEAIKERGFKGHAITDHGSMTNLIPFYHLMKKESLIPIMGVEFYYVDNPEEKTTDNRKSSHLILLAKNFEGWQNLCRLSRLSYTDGFYYKPKIGLEWLKRHREGLICLSACQGGVLSNHVWHERKSGRFDDRLENRFRQFKSIFGDDFYVEFQSHHTLTSIEGEDALFDSQAMVNQAFYERLRGLEGFKQIVTNDCHYIKPEHANIQRKLKEISWNGGNNSASVAADSATVTKDHFTDSLWLKNAVEVYESFRRNHEYLPKQFVAQGMLNSIEILEKCKDFEFPTKRYLPVFRPEVDSKELFKKLTTKLLIDFLKSDRVVAKKEQYVERYKEEYRVISAYGLEDYFLIVWDLVRFAKKNGIYTGLGRGSAAGCFISYLLGIVQIDPLEYGLIFERFLNENRCVSGELPDIDLDFESDRRKEIKDYIFKTYGRDKVCEIGTYGRMKLKTALIDFGKVLGVTTQKEILKITTSLDLDKEDVDSLIAAKEASPQLQILLDKNKDYSFFVTEIIGQIKSQGIHPAGVIICSEKLEDITPLKTQNRTLKPEEVDSDGEKSERILTTQAEDKYIIASGMMKADVLGLKEYDVIKFVINNVPDINMDVDNYVQKIMAKEKAKPNKKVWQMFQEGKTEGVFQFSSQGMKDLLQMMKPDCVNDLIAANALYRPGCLENGWHILYCDRKNGLEEIEYIHPDVEVALGTTFGVIVFQEQFMEVIHKLGGISLVDSDTIRSALGKKDKAKLDRFRAQFVEGASKKIDKTKALDLWRQIEKASGYAFNRSHSAAYSVLAYISQYFKVYYPAHFWAAQLDWDTRKNKLDDMLNNRRAASDAGVEYILPHINKSKMRFTVQENKVVWSFSSIKGIGYKAAQELQAKQPYKDFDDFYKRISKSKVKFNNIQALIHAGAFDVFGDRRELLKIVASKTKGKKYVSPTEEDLLRKFAESMGFFERKIKSLRGTFSHYTMTEQEVAGYDAGDTVRVGGMVTEVKTIKTKNGDNMGFVTLLDLDEKLSLTLFPRQWEEYRGLIDVGAIVEVVGTKSAYKNQHNCIEVDEIYSR